ncbi:hypothetical protein HYX10_04825 [Candidatus Woesearchaeota archaeon]|nr:hypothetical protein [Candidatus Woesearchaeota archaeon]
MLDSKISIGSHQITNAVTEEEKFLRDEGNRLKKAYKFIMGDNGAIFFLTRAVSQHGNSITINDRRLAGAHIELMSATRDIRYAKYDLHQAMNELQGSLADGQKLIKIAEYLAKKVMPPSGKEQEALAQAKNHVYKIKKKIGELYDLAHEMDNAINVNDELRLNQAKNMARTYISTLESFLRWLNSLYQQVAILYGLLKETKTQNAGRRNQLRSFFRFGK